MRLWTLRVVFALRRRIVHPRPDIFRRISSGQPIPIAWDWYIYLHEYGEIVWFSCGCSKYNYHGCYGIGMIKMHAKKHVWIHLVRCFLPIIFPSNWWRSFFGFINCTIGQIPLIQISLFTPMWMVTFEAYSAFEKKQLAASNKNSFPILVPLGNKENQPYLRLLIPSALQTTTLFNSGNTSSFNSRYVK